MWNGTWEKEKTRKVFMEEMIFEPISYWFGRIKTQKWRKDFLSRWNIMYTSSHESCATVVFLSQIFTFSFMCLLFHFLLTAHVCFLPRVSSVYFPMHLLRSNLNASFCAGKWSFISHISVLPMFIYISISLLCKPELLNSYIRFLESFYVPSSALGSSYSRELERLHK